MKFTRAIFLLLTCAFAITSWGDSSFTSLPENQKLIVNNRILAKVNDKTISVIDIVKKMDAFLHQAYPEYANSNVARYQFFSAHWRESLSQMIDNELMLADAEKLGLKAGDGEVRERLHDRFGPNLMTTLDKLGLTYEDAWKMIETEILVQKMTWYRINSKAIFTVNPQDLKLAYKDYVAKNPPVDVWKYQLLSIRAASEQVGRELSEKAHQLLDEERLDLPTVLVKLKEGLPEDTSNSITVSNEFEVNDKELSESPRQVLLTLHPNSFSIPIPQISRFDKSNVFRIFHLKEHSKKQPPSFEEMSDTLQEGLVQKAIQREQALYLNKIRERFTHDEKYIREFIPADFQPFALQ